MRVCQPSNETPMKEPLPYLAFALLSLILVIEGHRIFPRPRIMSAVIMFFFLVKHCLRLSRRYTNKWNVVPGDDASFRNF